jgi:hypothetical protein
MPGCCISMHSDPKTKSGMLFDRTIMVAIAANMHYRARLQSSVQSSAKLPQRRRRSAHSSFMRNYDVVPPFLYLNSW